MLLQFRDNTFFMTWTFFYLYFSKNNLFPYFLCRIFTANGNKRAVSFRSGSISRGFPSLELDTVVEEKSDPEQTQVVCDTWNNGKFNKKKLINLFYVNFRRIYWLHRTHQQTMIDIFVIASSVEHPLVSVFIFRRLVTIIIIIILIVIIQIVNSLATLLITIIPLLQIASRSLTL